MKVLIVIPCYNVEAVLPKTLDVLGNLIKTIKVKTDADTELLLVDDGSRDHTWQMISDCKRAHGSKYGKYQTYGGRRVVYHRCYILCTLLLRTSALSAA